MQRKQFQEQIDGFTRIHIDLLDEVVDKDWEADQEYDWFKVSKSIASRFHQQMEIFHWAMVHLEMNKVVGGENRLSPDIIHKSDVMNNTYLQSNDHFNDEPNETTTHALMKSSISNIKCATALHDKYKPECKERIVSRFSSRSLYTYKESCTKKTVNTYFYRFLTNNRSTPETPDASPSLI
uniref:Uncharacterized protein n=1 Tax=Romanomermis culicivorax TaxID=13658 RepID=A0A915J508_ROMCU